MAMTPISSAIAAYANVAKGPMAQDPLGQGNADPMAAASGTPATSFSAILQDAAKVAIGAVKSAEQSSAAGIAGKADIREVVNAVNNAELTLETVVAVRDKVINAYNEILRMPI